MAGPADHKQTWESVLAGLGLLAVVIVGAIWTAAAVQDGSVTGMLLRFALSIAGGFYYLVVYRVATGQSLARR